jgi:hypothetical protein
MSQGRVTVKTLFYAAHDIPTIQHSSPIDQRSEPKSHGATRVRE